MLKSRHITTVLAIALTGVGVLAAGSAARADLIPTEPQRVVTSSSPDASPAATSNPPQPPIGFDIGEYLPTDAVVRGRFGSQWFSIGLGEGGIPSVAGKGQVRLELDVLSNQRGNNRAILVPLGIAYNIGLGSGSIVPYAGFSADIMNTVIQSSTDAIKSEYRAGLAGSVYGGVNINHDVNVEIRYRDIEKIAGYNFNGVEGTLGLRF